MSDFSVYRKLETARISSSGDIVNPSQPISQSHQRTDRFSFSTTTANVAESPFLTVPYPAVLKTANLVATANTTANAAQGTIVNVYKRTGNGAAVLMATANTANTAVTAFVPVPLVLVANAANTQFAAGDECTVSTTVIGTGGSTVASCDILFEDIA